MNKYNLDSTPLEHKMAPDRSILLGTMYATTLIYLHHNAYPISTLLVRRYMENGVLTFAIRNLIPIVIVILIGLLFKKMMHKTSSKRMVKVYITWLSSLFIYFVLYHFHFSQSLPELLSKPYNPNLIQNSHVFRFSTEPDFLIKYIHPLFLPFTIAVIIYLAYISFVKTKSTQL